VKILKTQKILPKSAQLSTYIENENDYKAIENDYTADFSEFLPVRGSFGDMPLLPFAIEYTALYGI